MGLLTESLLIDSANDAILESSARGFQKTASQVLIEHNRSMDIKRQYDFFICHAKMDEKLILGLVELLKMKGFTSYVDWIDDAKLDRTDVNAETAKLIKNRIKQSKCLIYAHTDNSAHSKWMPWELGYADSQLGKVAICPITKQNTSKYDGQEYLGIYPFVFISQLKDSTDQTEKLWVYEIDTSAPWHHLLIKDWIKPRKFE